MWPVKSLCSSPKCLVRLKRKKMEVIGMANKTLVIMFLFANYINNSKFENKFRKHCSYRYEQCFAFIVLICSQHCPFRYEQCCAIDAEYWKLSRMGYTLFTGNVPHNSQCPSLLPKGQRRKEASNKIPCVLVFCGL